MKIKINYTFFGGAEQNVIYMGDLINFSNEQLGSYQQSNYRHIPGDDENIDIHKQYFRFNRDNLLNRPCVAVQNGGYVQQNRNNINQTNTDYSEQCMYISIYDYLTLKLGKNFTFEQFRTENNINTTREFDSNDSLHKQNLTRLAARYGLDIRVWDKNPQRDNKKIYFNNFEIHTQNIQVNEYNIEHITYNFRRGAGNPHIVNILSHRNHFELIVGGSDFTPLFSENEFNNFNQNIRDSMSHYTTYVGDDLVNIENMKREEEKTDYNHIFARELQEQYDKENLEFINNRNNGNNYATVEDYINDFAMALELQNEENENHLRSLTQNIVPDPGTDSDLAIALSLSENPLIPQENPLTPQEDEDLALALSLEDNNLTQEQIDNEMAQRLQNKEYNQP